MPSLAEFKKLWSALHLPADSGVQAGPAGPKAVYENLRARYGEPHRKFHNFAHIEFCLQLLKGSRDLAVQPDLVAAAIWFHDAIYDTHASDNEEKSALLADNLLPLRAAEKATVHYLIMDTCHTAPPDTQDGKLLADIDLAGIGGSSASFAEGCAQIREEYGWVPVETYKASRGKFLRGLLNKPAIYHTAPFHTKYEALARQNLQEELDRLAAMK
ncbi:MAG TPA: N-methyl-D-aspartate receptor NMDAR2C subunit [Planctomycetota bacterium]|nr:N-methyl-D-aspartate receptor NMDAR2C subunit [Planctomycetota bacterium]